jgi:hypothetical protein
LPILELFVFGFGSFFAMVAIGLLVLLAAIGIKIFGSAGKLSGSTLR